MRKFILRHSPCAQFRVYIFVQRQQSLVHQVQGSERGDWLTNGACLEKRGSSNRCLPTLVGEPVALLANNLSAIDYRET